MTRKIRLALGLKFAALLLVIGLMPVRAWAESPKEFYENLAATVGVTVDLASEAWQDKTISAYLEYINQNISGGTPYSFYQYGVQLEALTGYDVAYVEDGKYYINSAPGDGSGGAFYGVECNQWNLSSLALETSKWLKYAAENGPEWPNDNSGGGSGGGGEGSGGGYYGDYIIVYEESISQGYTFTDGYTVKDSLVNTINSALSNSLVRVCGLTDNKGLSTSNYSASKDNSMIYASDNSFIIYSSVQFGNSTVMNNAISEKYSCPDTGYYLERRDIATPITHFIVNCPIFGNSGGGGGGDEPSNDPPIETPQAPNIVFPGITLPDFPDFNTTNNYTPGEIDFTPIIERLDDIDTDLELFYNSFNEFRADFLTYMNGIGDALNTINQSIWSCEQRLESVITWLKNIFSRLGGTGGSKPDPSTNQDGFWEWLREMLEKLFGALPTETDDMLTQFQRLTTRFPFSVPWDVYALLAMFVSQPVTPVIDMPFPMPEMIYPNGYFMAHIDLTPYDGVAAMVRKLELVAFVGWLTWRTFDMIRGGEEVVG